MRLNGVQWAVSLALGAISLPVAVIIRLIPNDLIKRIIPIGLDYSPKRLTELPDDDGSEQDEELENMRAAFRIRRNSRLSPLSIQVRKLREIFSSIGGTVGL